MSWYRSIPDGEEPPPFADGIEDTADGSADEIIWSLIRADLLEEEEEDEEEEAAGWP